MQEVPSPAGEGEARNGGAAGRAVVIVGGGFGGLYTAQALASRRHHPPLLLIEPGERFVFSPLLYELLSGEMRRWEIAPRYDELLAGQGLAWLQDRVESIDTETRRVHTRSGRSIPYARLVIATGAARNTFGVPGAEAHTLSFRTPADVDRILELLQALKEQSHPLQRLAVVGAGPTGVELACKLADLTAGSAVIELIEQGPAALPLSPAFNREQALLALRRRDVRLRTHTRVTAVEADRLLLRPTEEEEGNDRTEPVPVKGVIWTAGLRFLPPAISPPARQDERGRLICEPDLRLLNHQAEFVAGDLAATTTLPAPTTAQVAFQQAPVLAGNILRSLAGEPLQPFQHRDLGEMLSLGRHEACLTGMGLTLAGPAAYQLRRLAYLTRLPGRSHPWRVAAGWLADAGS